MQCGSHLLYLNPQEEYCDSMTIKNTKYQSEETGFFVSFSKTRLSMNVPN